VESRISRFRDSHKIGIFTSKLVSQIFVVSPRQAINDDTHFQPGVHLICVKMSSRNNRLSGLWMRFDVCELQQVNSDKFSSEVTTAMMKEHLNRVHPWL
jgi:hypothetical protein